MIILFLLIIGPAILAALKNDKEPDRIAKNLKDSDYYKL